MNKKTLENFINKYNIAGQVESVTVKASDTGLTVAFSDTDRRMTGFLSTDSINLPVGDYDIYETAALKGLMAVLGEDITIDVQKNSVGNPTSFLMTDGVTKVKFVLAESDAIPSVPQPKRMPEFEAVITLDEKFVTTFVKAVGAMRDSEVFTFMSDGSEVKVILGYDPSINQNSVSITATATENGVMSPINFSSKFLREILQANKDMTAGVMRVSSLGIVEVEFTVPEFNTVKYYLLKVAED